MDVRSCVHHGLVERLPLLFGRDALEERVGHHRCGVVAHHAAAVARRGPFGQEAAFAGRVGQSLLDFGVHRRIDQIEQREQTAERVPEPGVGIHVAGEHFAVVGAVVHDLARSGHFIEFTREKHRTVQARIEGAHLLFGAALDLDAAQHFVPALLRLGLDGLEVVGPQLPEILNGLFGRDERRSHAGADLLAAAGREVHLRHGVSARHRLAAVGIEQAAAGFVLAGSVGQLDGRERRIEAHDEVIAEIIRNAAAVARGVTHDRAGVEHADLRTAVEGVDHNARLVAFGKGEAHHRGTFGRGDLGADVVVGQIDPVIVGLRHLGLVRIPARAGLFVQLIIPAHGHQRELAVVVDPRRGLVGLLEAPDPVRPVGIGPAVAHLAGLGRPEVHTPRQSDGRIGIARRKREIRLRAYQCRNIVRRTLRESLPGRRARTAGQNGGAKGREKDISTFHCCHFRLKFVP